MKKKTLLMLLALTLSLLLSGCGGTSATVSPSEEDAPPVSEPAEDVENRKQPVEDAEEPTEEPEESSDEAAVPAEDAEVVDPEETPENQEEASPAPEAAPAQPETPAEIPASTPEPIPEPAPTPATTPEPVTTEPEPAPEETPASNNTTLSGTDLTLRFGGGEEFSIHMYDNDTANKIAEYVGTAAWQLPIYHFDDYDGWESFQYYDIPSRYDIPDGSQSVTSEKAGAVYYSHPNRIILFYQDANVSSEYTPIGYIDFSQDLVDAVENNPVVEGWGNKLVFVQP